MRGKRGIVRKRGHGVPLGGTCLSEKRENRGNRSRRLSRRQAERGSKSFRDAEQLDREGSRGWGTGIACQSLYPREAIVRSLCSGEDRWRGIRAGREGLLHLYFDALATQELHARSPMLPPAPVLPEDWSWPNAEGMQQHTHLARLAGGTALPLTLFPQRTGAATANAGRIHHAQAAIGFSTSLMGRKRVPCWTPERPIRLERKVLPREATRFPGGGSGGWAIPRCGSR